MEKVDINSYQKNMVYLIKTQVKKWVNAYKTLGDDGLKLKNKHTNYPIQFKLEVINYMATTKSSLQETANHFGMNNNSTYRSMETKIFKWW